MFLSRKKNKQHPVYDKPKTTTFYFNQIRHYFDLHANESVINDRVWNDLDMDEVFMFADRTITKPGQQYLYYTLRQVRSQPPSDIDQEGLLSEISEDKVTRTKLVQALEMITKGGSYQLGHLLDNSKINRPNWFFMIPVCSIISFILIPLSFLYSWAALSLTLLLASNFVVHLWNKRNVFPLVSSIGDLITLKIGARKLLELETLESYINFPHDAYRDIKSISRNVRLIKTDYSMIGELNQFVDFLTELLKASFLIEPLVLYKLSKEIADKERSIKLLFEFVGRLDVVLSVDALRKDLSYYCQPDLQNTSLEFRGLYHPLIIDGQSNSLSNAKSCLITGSNMSGKSTFIKTIGINVIMGQSLNTCCAHAYASPRLKLLTAIKSTDNIIEQVSYYLDEVERIKKMIDESGKANLGLFLIDEIFKGTNTEERVAAGAAVLNYLAQKNHVFATTHDLELANLVSDQFSLFHFSEDKNGQFDHQIKPGKLRSTNAIKWLVQKDYPDEIIAMATGYLKNHT